MPPKKTLELKQYSNLGYVKPTATTQQRFKELAEQLKTTIRVVAMGGVATAQRREEDMDYDGLVIYDYSTPDDVNGAMGPSQQSTMWYTPPKSSTSIEYDKSKSQEIFLEAVPYACAIPAESGDLEILHTSPQQQGGIRTAVAVVKENTIWVLTAMSNFSHSRCRTWLYPAIEKSLNKDFWADRISYLQKDLQENFFNRIESAAQSEKKLLKETVDQIDAKTAAYDEAIIILARRREQVANRLAFMEAEVEQDKEYYKKQFDEIVGHNRVTRVRWDSGQDAFVITTDEVYLYDPMKIERAPLGKFDIKFKRNGAVLFFNLTRKRGGRMTPHVGSGGSPCWGASAQVVRKLAATAEFVSLLEVCFAYLEQYNPNDLNATSGSYWFTEDETEMLKDGKWVLKKNLTKKEIEKIEKGTEKKSIEGEDVLGEEVIERDLEVH